MKHNKLFAMLAVAAALAVSACSGNGGSASSSAHKHTAAPDAPWQHDNNNHWKDCEANDGGKAENAKHTFGDPTDVVPATCTATGSQKVKCTVCGAEVTQTLPMIDHTWGEWEVTAAADCTNAGSRKHTCSVCGEVATEEIPATGHTWGEWETTKEAKCGVAGSRKHKCSVCGVEESEVIEALEHELELVGGETQAPVGEATVRLYRCKLCGETSLGFAADEPSEASLPHLMKGDHDGMRFFGRPIGNALALTADGTSVNQQTNECVYCSAETGDFFEYVFTLNAAQAQTLATCRLYCDARPADYLSGDFWAYNRSADDWTPGYYIDGADEHVQHNDDGSVKMIKDHAQAVKQDDGSYAAGVELETEVKAGARIEDYRYILYVDGQPVDFDPDTSVQAKGSNTNMTRAEYVLPYTFHLKEGKNTISLRMAGGYRSEFYNFIFRPYVEPTQITINQDKVEMKVGETAQITSTFTELNYASANAQIASVDANGVITGVKAGETTITVSKDGNFKPAKLPVKINEKDGIYQVEVETGASSKGEDGADLITFREASGGHNSTNAFPKDAVLTLSFNVAEAGTYSMKIDARKNRSGVGSDFDNKFTSAFEMKLNDNAIATDATVGSSWADSLIGDVELKAGANTLTFKALRDDNPINLDYVRFEPGEAVPPHEHTFGTPAAQTDEAESTIASCECGYKNIKWSAKKFNEAASVIGTKDSSENGSTGIKFSGSVYNKTSGTASEGDHAVYNVNVPEAVASAQLYMRFNRKDTVSAFSAPSGDQSPSYYQKEDGSWGKYEWRYKLFINDVEVPFVPYEQGQEPQTIAKTEVEFAFPCTFALKAGVNKVELQKWGGYTATIVDFTFAYGA